jgi:hypothetical protein
MQSKTTPPKRRTTSGPKPAGESAPVALIEKARALTALDLQLRLTLPESLRRQCCLADVRSGRLVFLANSSIWAAKLRLHQTQLLDAARTALRQDIKTFTVKVANLASVPPEPTRRKPLSRTAADYLKTAANSLADPDLRALYLRLASLADITDPDNGDG